MIRNDLRNIAIIAHVDHVAQIITFGTLAAKAAVKDVGRALDVPLSTVNQVNKMIPNVPGTTLKEALKNSKELRALCAEDETVAKMLDFAQKVEGMPRHTSTHEKSKIIARTKWVFGRSKRSQFRS